MNITQYLDIVKLMHNGSVIFEDKQNDCEINLGTDELKLYITGNKYYFVAKYNENLNQIENNIFENEIVKMLSDRQPNNSYLILIYNVETITNEIYKEIIKLEENEFFYKKYVLYYTDEEFQAFMEWWNKIEKKELRALLSDQGLNPNATDKHIKFLFRLLIKTPFIHLEFPKTKMKNFEDLLDRKIQNLTTEKVAVIQLYNNFSGDYLNMDSQSIANTIFKEIVEEG